MGKLSASDITGGMAKAGDIVKGKGKGTMKTGAGVIATALLAVGAGIGASLVKLMSKKK